MKYIVLFLLATVLLGTISAQDTPCSPCDFPAMSVDALDIAQFGDRFLETSLWNIKSANVLTGATYVDWDSPTYGSFVSIGHMTFGYTLDEQSISDYFDKNYFDRTYPYYAPYSVHRTCQSDGIRIHEMEGVTHSTDYVMREWVEQVGPQELRRIFMAVPETHADLLSKYGRQLFDGPNTCDELESGDPDPLEESGGWMESLVETLDDAFDFNQRVIYHASEAIEGSIWFDPDNWSLFALSDYLDSGYVAYQDHNGNVLMVIDSRKMVFATYYESLIDQDLAIIFPSLSINHVERCAADDYYIVKTIGSDFANNPHETVQIVLPEDDVMREIRLVVGAEHSDISDKIVTEILAEYEPCELEEVLP